MAVFDGLNAMLTVSLRGAPRRSSPSTTPGARLAAALLATLGALVLAGPAAARPAPAAPSSSKLLWATVNVCDTRAHPDTVGVRGSMPGSGVRGERMFMRFELQFLDPSDQEWESLAPGDDAGWVPVGAASYKQRQAGRNFVVPPPQTGSFVLRGLVSFEWRAADGEVTLRARRTTSGGHGATAGADPQGASSSRCELRA